MISPIDRSEEKDHTRLKRDPILGGIPIRAISQRRERSHEIETRPNRCTLSSPSASQPRESSDEIETRTTTIRSGTSAELHRRESSDEIETSVWSSECECSKKKAHTRLKLRVPARNESWCFGLSKEKVHTKLKLRRDGLTPVRHVCRSE